MDAINTLDTFLLTMAMTALGAESSFEKFKKAGARPFLLAGFLYIWLFFGGYWLVKLISLEIPKTFLLRKEGKAYALPFRTGEKSRFTVRT